MEVDEAGFYDRLLDYSNILYLCHRNADPDAVGSAFALAESIGGTIGIGDGVNRVAGMLIDQLGIEVVLDPNPADYDFTVAVSYTHLRAHETRHDLVCRLLLEKKK